MASVKALVQIGFPMHALTNPYLEAKCQKWLGSKHCYFVKKYFNGIKLLHPHVQCVHIMYAKYQTVSVKAVVEV